MAALCGILGKNDPDAVREMARAMAHRGDAVHLESGSHYAVACSDPPGKTPCLIDGAPRTSAGVLDAKGFRKQCGNAEKPGGLALQGPFAAVVKVKGNNEWWLLRDRLGVKPLYYYYSAGCLVFASELKGLLASGHAPRRLNLLSVDRYLTLRCTPGPETILQDIRRVKSGHAVVFEDGTAVETPFAQFDLEQVDTTKEDAAHELETRLVEGIQHNGAEGLLWSGGLDCASLAAIEPSAHPVHVLLQSSWQSEQRLARESAKRLRLEVDERKARRLNDATIRRALRYIEEPIGDASILPLWLVIEEAAKSETTLMTGHGADELLGGYPRYHFIDKAPGSARSLVPVNLLAALQPALPPNAFIQRGGHVLANIRDNLGAYLSALAVFSESERDDLYTEAMKTVVHEHGGSTSIMEEHFAQQDLAQSQLSFDLGVTLPDVILAQCDRVASAHGVDMHFPYLDDGLVDLVNSLPSKVKFGVRSKPLLRLAMKGRLPARIRTRARRGFRIPQDGPVMKTIEQFAENTLTQERIEASGLFRWAPVQKIMRGHSHNIYRRRQFWALLLFFGWYREIMES